MSIKFYFTIIIFIIVIIPLSLSWNYGILQTRKKVESNLNYSLEKNIESFTNYFNKNISLAILAKIISSNKLLKEKLILKHKYQVKSILENYIKDFNINKLILFYYDGSIFFKHNIFKFNSQLINIVKKNKKINSFIYDNIKNKIYFIFGQPIIEDNYKLGYFFLFKEIPMSELLFLSNVNNVYFKLYYENKEIFSHNVKSNSQLKNKNIFLKDVLNQKIKLVFTKPIDKYMIEYKKIKRDFFKVATLIFIITFILGFSLLYKVVNSLEDLRKVTKIITLPYKPKSIKKSRLKELKLLAENFEKMLFKLSDSQNKMLQSEKLATAGKLAAGLSHELNNPLVSVSGYTQLLLEEIDNPKYKKYLLNIEKNIERSQKLIKTLLQYSRKQTICISKFKIFEFITEVSDLIDIQIRKKNVKLIVKHKLEKNIFLKTDKEKLKQILLNILINSIEAVEPKKGKIILKTEIINNNFVLTITDNGTGIPDTDLEKVFEPFYTTKDTGTGLGLYLCYNYLQQLNGKLFLKQNENNIGLKTIIKLEIS